jgi:hypothetical protein
MRRAVDSPGPPDRYPKPYQAQEPQQDHRDDVIADVTALGGVRQRMERRAGSFGASGGGEGRATAGVGWVATIVAAASTRNTNRTRQPR